MIMRWIALAVLITALMLALFFWKTPEGEHRKLVVQLATENRSAYLLRMQKVVDGDVLCYVNQGSLMVTLMSGLGCSFVLIKDFADPLTEHAYSIDGKVWGQGDQIERLEMLTPIGTEHVYKTGLPVLFGGSQSVSEPLGWKVGGGFKDAHRVEVVINGTSMCMFVPRAQPAAPSPPLNTAPPCPLSGDR